MRRTVIYLILLALSVCGCKKSPPGIVQPTPTYQDPLLAKLTLITPAKTYVDEYTYDTLPGTYRNCLVMLRSQIAGKIIKFTYAQDISFRVTLDTVSEYDINTNSLIDRYAYTGYYTGEPATPPYQKDVTVIDPNKKVLRTFTYVRGDLNAPVRAIAVGSDTTTRISNDSAGNMLLYDPGNGNTIAYTYDNKHHPDALYDWENEQLQFSVYATPQTFINNPLTITTGGATKTYSYQYNQYGYPTSAAISDGTSMKYEYVAKR